MRCQRVIKNGNPRDADWLITTTRSAVCRRGRSAASDFQAGLGENRFHDTISTVSTVSIVRDNDYDPRSSQPPRGPVAAARDDSHRPGSTAADDADGADAKAALHFFCNVVATRKGSFRLR
jgi:hypothetical protein